MDTELRARPRTSGFWGKERARALTLWGLPRDVAKPDAGPPLSPPLRAATAGGAGARALADGGTPRHSARPAPTRSRPAAAPTPRQGAQGLPSPQITSVTNWAGGLRTCKHSRTSAAVVAGPGAGEQKGFPSRKVGSGEAGSSVLTINGQLETSINKPREEFRKGRFSNSENVDSFRKVKQLG